MHYLQQYLLLFLLPGAAKQPEGESPASLMTTAHSNIVEAWQRSSDMSSKLVNEEFKSFSLWRPTSLLWGVTFIVTQIKQSIEPWNRLFHQFPWSFTAYWDQVFYWPTKSRSSVQQSTQREIIQWNISDWYVKTHLVCFYCLLLLLRIAKHVYMYVYTVNK